MKKVDQLDHPDHDDLLDRAIRALRETPVPERPARDELAPVLADVDTVARPKLPTSAQRIFTMKSMIRTAAAACVSAALGLGLFWILAQSGPELAFADMADALLKLQTVTYRVTMHSQTKVSLPWGERTVTTDGTGKAMFRAPSWHRMEMESASSVPSLPSLPWTGKASKAAKPPEPMKKTMIQIFDVTKSATLTLEPQQKLATLMHMENMSEEARTKQGDLFFNLRSVIEKAKAGEKNVKIVPLGEKTIDGRAAVGYSLRQELLGVKWDFWFERATALPVRIELAMGQTTGGQFESNMVMDQFQTGMDLDPSLFSLEAPKGYTTHEFKIDYSEPTITDLGKMLRVLAERNKNVFPDELPNPKDSMKLIMRETSKDTMLRSFLGGMKAAMKRAKGEPVGNEKAPEIPPAEMQAMVDRTQKISRGLTFLGVAMGRENDWHYAGKGVKLDAPDVPIFWYKPAGSEKYRVLCADLSVKEVAKDELPKVGLPESEPPAK